MDDYEFRFVTRQYQIARVVRNSHASDFAAIRRAGSLTPRGYGVEVWRGLDCIYVNYGDQPLFAAEPMEALHGI